MLWMIDYDPHRWFDHFFDIHGSMVREILGRVTACVAWSALVVAFHYYVRPVGVPSTVHTLIGVALGLLLVFRTNASYDRFWEGRKQWGGMVNETRNLCRASKVLLRERPELFQELSRWTIAFAYAAMNSLRGTRGLGPVQAELPAAAASAVRDADHPPLAASIRMSETLAAARREGVISDYVQMKLDDNVQLLIDYVGACERIHRTPLPFAYVVHLRRALVFYCYTLPFALVDQFGASTIVDVLLVAYTLFGIEELGVEIEDPFGADANDLPLETICQTIERNLRAVMEAPAGRMVTSEQS